MTHTQAVRQVRTHGGSPLPNEPPGKFQGFVSKSTAPACEHIFVIDHGRVFRRRKRMQHSFNFQGKGSLQSAQDRVARGGELLTALSRRGQGGSFRCKTVSTDSVQKGAMTRRRASTATLFSLHNEERRVQIEPPFFWSLGIRGRNQ